MRIARHFSMPHPALGVLVCLAAAAHLSCAAGTEASERAGDANRWRTGRVLNIAHAGGEFEAPTNTLYAMKRAVAAGADMLEFDVQRSKDGRLVVIHDATVDRVTNGYGRVDAFTLAELRALDKAYWFRPSCEMGCREEFPYRGIAVGERPAPDGYAPEDFQIATVQDVLDAFPRTPMSIEIKGDEDSGAFDIADELAAVLEEKRRTSDVLIGAFSDAVMATFRKAAPAVDTSPATVEAFRWWLLFGGARGHEALQIPPYVGRWETATPETVARAHGAGLAVIVWFEDRWERTGTFEPLVHELLDAGVDGIITARPSALQRILTERDGLRAESG